MSVVLGDGERVKELVPEAVLVTVPLRVGDGERDGVADEVAVSEGVPEGDADCEGV